MSKTLKQKYLVKKRKSLKKGGKSKSKIIRKKRQNITRKYGGDGNNIELNYLVFSRTVDVNGQQITIDPNMNRYENTYEVYNKIIDNYEDKNKNIDDLQEDQFDATVQLVQNKKKESNPNSIQDNIQSYPFIKFIYTLRKIYKAILSYGITTDVIDLPGNKKLNIYEWLKNVYKHFDLLHRLTHDHYSISQFNNEDLIRLVSILHRYNVKFNDSNVLPLLKNLKVEFYKRFTGVCKTNPELMKQIVWVSTETPVITYQDKGSYQVC